MADAEWMNFFVEHSQATRSPLLRYFRAPEFCTANDQALLGIEGETHSTIAVSEILRF